jgi:hypothetical protein
LAQLSAQRGRSLGQPDLAAVLPTLFFDHPTLAVLFDQRVSLALADARIRLQPEMQYAYATSGVSATSEVLVFELDTSDVTKPIEARALRGLAEVASRHFPVLTERYPPLSNVQNYAAIAAFLRWAGCARIIKEECAAHKGVTIDFSMLGRYDLRDRATTPTPDMDAR